MNLTLPNYFLKPFTPILVWKLLATMVELNEVNPLRQLSQNKNDM